MKTCKEAQLSLRASAREANLGLLLFTFGALFVRNDRKLNLWSWKTNWLLQRTYREQRHVLS